MWTKNDNLGLEYYITPGFAYRPNIAIFSFNKTLIQNIYSKHNSSMQLLSENVVGVLDNINEKGSIIIIENRFYRIHDIQKHIKEFIGLFDHDIEFIAMFIKKQNCYQKPNTNIMKKIQEIYMQNNPDFSNFEMDKSIVVGCNAGRFKYIDFRTDTNDSDRAFAENLKIPTFRTPEQIFMNILVARKWKWGLPHVSKLLEDQKNKIEPPFSEILDVRSEKIIVFITGSLSSGKSTLARRLCDYIKRFNTKFIYKDINKSNTGEICEALEEFNQNDTNIFVLVDILYNERLDQYLNLIKPTIDVIHLEMEASAEISIFLDRFRLQICQNPNIIAYKKDEIEKWYLLKRTKIPSISYVYFPLILRTREESFYRYTI